MIRALFDGIGRVLSAPVLVAGVYLLTLLLAAPLTLALHDAIASHLGASVAAEQAAAGVHWAWWEEFQAQARGFERTFTPSIIGFGAVLSNLSAFVDGAAPSGGLAVAVAFYLAAWTFLAGGVLDRLARRRRLGAAAFFAACGTYFFRFLRLAVVAGLAYWLLFDLVHGWLLDDLYQAVTRGVTVERTAFVVRLAGYALFGALVLPVNLLLDYAKIRAVVEDRRSMLGALLAAGRFVRRRPFSTGGLYVLNTGLFGLLLAGYAAVDPGAGAPDGTSPWTALLIGQAYVLARVATKLVFYASQTAYFQSQLAHAGYVAAAQPAPPEAPAAETRADTAPDAGKVPAS